MGTGKGPPFALLAIASLSPSLLAMVRERPARATATSSDGMAPDSDGDNYGTTPATRMATMMERRSMFLT
ncbi:hypothetical protein TIFTF001_025349 [Ficus carica]|uniref:Secreted protein n=1 Tax=Ficus carica TaxID=3494 RepID=A0AA88DGK5_FICCA|nr:hypothetical protein TIFTF001_025349 [Ficus carica]